jgi:hypothetical protein
MPKRVIVSLIVALGGCAYGVLYYVREVLLSRFREYSYVVSPSTICASFTYAVLDDELEELDAMFVCVARELVMVNKAEE